MCVSARRGRGRPARRRRDRRSGRGAARAGSSGRARVASIRRTPAASTVAATVSMLPVRPLPRQRLGAPARFDRVFLSEGRCPALSITFSCRADARTPLPAASQENPIAGGTVHRVGRHPQSPFGRPRPGRRSVDSPGMRPLPSTPPSPLRKPAPAAGRPPPSSTPCAPDGWGIAGVGSTRPGDGATFAAIAATRVIADAVVSHRSAAMMRNQPIVGARPALPEITVPPGASANHPDLHLHRAALRPCDVEIVDGTPVTSVARTCVDVGRHRPFATSVALIDAVLHGRLATLDDIEGALRHCWNWPRIRRAQRALDLADGRAESPLESISRLGFDWLAICRCPNRSGGSSTRRPSESAASTSTGTSSGVVGEADGQDKYDDATDADRRREAATGSDGGLGLVVVRWGWQEAWRQHDGLRRKTHSAFERGRRAGSIGFSSRMARCDAREAVPPSRKTDGNRDRAS